jgi:hypothetical protein
LAAWSRNRPRSGLAWILLVALGVLVALATRAAAAPAEREPGTAMAIAFADALTGEPRCENDVTDDGDADGDPEDVAATSDLDPELDDGDDPSCQSVPIRPGPRLVVPASSDPAADLPSTDAPSPIERAGSPELDEATLEDPDLDGLAALDGAELDDPGSGPAGLDGAAGREPADAADRTGDGYLAEGSRDELAGSRDPIEIGFAPGAFVDTELYDLEARHQRPSRWGRVDLSLAWRRAVAVRTMSRRRDDELWLLATWRR